MTTPPFHTILIHMSRTDKWEHRTDTHTQNLKRKVKVERKANNAAMIQLKNHYNGGK